MDNSGLVRALHIALEERLSQKLHSIRNIHKILYTVTLGIEEKQSIQIFRGMSRSDTSKYLNYLYGLRC